MRPILPLVPILLALLLAGCGTVYTPREMRAASFDDLALSLRDARMFRSRDDGYAALLREELISRLPVDDQNRFAPMIRSGHLCEGMSSDAVLASWGAPVEKRGERTPVGDFSTWRYGRTTIHFTDGRVTWWSQESR